MLVRILTVGESAKGRTYARDIAGRTFFPQQADLALKAGDYAFVVETTQTMTYADDGTTLVKLDTPVKILQITAVFPDKATAIGAAAESGMLELEVRAEVIKSAKDLKLSDATIKELSNAAF